MLLRGAILLLFSTAIFASRIGGLEGAALSASTLDAAGLLNGEFSSYILSFPTSYTRSAGPTLPALTPVAVQPLNNADGSSGHMVSRTFMTTPMLQPSVVVESTIPPMTELEIASFGVSNIFLNAPIQQDAVAAAGAMFAGDGDAPTSLVGTTNAHGAGQINNEINGPVGDSSGPENVGTDESSQTNRPSDVLSVDASALSVPEPSTVFGVMFALAGLGLLQRKRSGRHK